MQTWREILDAEPGLTYNWVFGLGSPDVAVILVDGDCEVTRFFMVNELEDMRPGVLRSVISDMRGVLRGAA